MDDCIMQSLPAQLNHLVVKGRYPSLHRSQAPNEPTVALEARIRVPSRSPHPELIADLVAVKHTAGCLDEPIRDVDRGQVLECLDKVVPNDDRRWCHEEFVVS